MQFKAFERGADNVDKNLLAVELSFLEKPARHILEQIKEKLDDREYDSIIGDDASARAHTILLAKIIQQMYGEDKKIETHFIQSGRLMREPEHLQEVQKRLMGIKNKLGKKTLIITEEIFTGNSILSLVAMLKNLGIDTDVATFNTLHDHPDDTAEVHDKFKEKGVNLYEHQGISARLSSEFSGLWSATQNPFAVALVDHRIDKNTLQYTRDIINDLANKIATDFK
jgi:orotate phosphoribosyltransferase